MCYKKEPWKQNNEGRWNINYKLSPDSLHFHIFWPIIAWPVRRHTQPCTAFTKWSLLTGQPLQGVGHKLLRCGLLNFLTRSQNRRIHHILWLNPASCWIKTSFILKNFDPLTQATFPSPPLKTDTLLKRASKVKADDWQDEPCRSTRRLFHVNATGDFLLLYICPTKPPCWFSSNKFHMFSAIQMALPARHKSWRGDFKMLACSTDFSIFRNASCLSNRQL